MKLVFFVTFILFLAGLVLGKTAQAVPLKELRRRARAKDPASTSIYKAAAYGKSLEVLLTIVASLGLGAAVLIAASITWWAGLGLFLIGSGLYTAWQPSRKSDSWIWKISARLAPTAAWILSHIHPLSGRAGDSLSGRTAARLHTRAYEKEDLLELISAQNNQTDNRIPEEDLHLALGALTFGDKTVGSVMAPRRKVKLVSEQDSIGPLLMDELHASGHKWFPVVSGPVKAASPQVIGTLSLHDLVGYSGKGKVGDVAKHERYFINESQTLRQALSTSLKTHHQLLIVVNNYEEIVGTLSLEDIMEQIIGKPVMDEFDKHNDLPAVSGLKIKQSVKAEQHRKSSEQTSKSVVE
ncbi:MAG: CBS domain-containing protein [Candidatus Saccharimonadales bacterium]